MPDSEEPVIIAGSGPPTQRLGRHLPQACRADDRPPGARAILRPPAEVPGMRDERWMHPVASMGMVVDIIGVFLQHGQMPPLPSEDLYKFVIPSWDVDDFSKSTWHAVEERTQTGPARVFALIDAVRYTSERSQRGDIVECGVWRGGSMLAAAMTLGTLPGDTRRIFLYDTFNGMPSPGEDDFRFRDGAHARELLASSPRTADVWAHATRHDVEQGFEEAGIDSSKLVYVEGLMEETIPEVAPENISVLRLDSDYYSSTSHCLRHLYPRLVSGGVLIIDDYGWWNGARRAVDEYFEETGSAPYMIRCDEGRVAVKP